MAATYQSDPSVFIPNRFDSAQRQQQGAHHHPYQLDGPHEIPPSPTLTNPDMILPFEIERESSTPSPPFRLSSSSDAPMLNGGPQAPRSAMNHDGDSDSQIGVAVTMPVRPPRPRWAYEGHAPGPPLSDIGEEEILLSPPRAGPYRAEEHGDELESCSSGSSSTISAHGGHVKGHEQMNPNEERLEDKRNSFVGHGSVEEARMSAGVALVSGGSHPEERSSVILSSEAERILENAKKRLTLMEGNLTRARSSMRLTPSPSLSSPSLSGSLLPARNSQPAGGLYRSISQTDRRSSVLRPRPVYSVTPETNGNHHSRGHSETNLPSSGNQTSHPLQSSRSMSALGSTSASQYERDEPSFPYNFPSSNAASRPSSAYYHSGLDALWEDESRKTSLDDPSGEYPSGLGISTENAVRKMSSMEDFNSAYPSEGPPSRAQSQLQVRELKDQAAGLKTKISLLKVKTQEDNLRRRSLQSLRTPSPFTAAEQWYTSAMEYREGDSNLSANAGYGWSPKSAPEEGKASSPRTPEEDEHTSEPSTVQHVSENASSDGKTAAASEVAPGSFGSEDDIQSLLESHYEDAEESAYDDDMAGLDIDRDKLNEILNEPLDDEDDEDDIFEDVSPGMAPEATPHEDREDAFDYENFILHSALGTYTRSRMRRLSYSSTGSVETTRPSQDQRPDGPSRHVRSGSGDSISTLATFATATENAYTSDDEDSAEHDIYQALDWPQTPMNDVNTIQRRRSTVESRTSQAHNLVVSPVRTSGILTPPASAVRDSTGSMTPVDAFMSSLNSSAPSGTSSRPSSSLNQDDTRLLEQVFDSLGKVCAELQEFTMADVDADPKYIRTLRRRLDAARRVLDGQLDP